MVEDYSPHLRSDHDIFRNGDINHGILSYMWCVPCHCQSLRRSSIHIIPQKWFHFVGLLVDNGENQKKRLNSIFRSIWWGIGTTQCDDQSWSLKQVFQCKRELRAESDYKRFKSLWPQELIIQWKRKRGLPLTCFGDPPPSSVLCGRTHTSSTYRRIKTIA